MKSSATVGRSAQKPHRHQQVDIIGLRGGERLPVAPASTPLSPPRWKRNTAGRLVVKPKCHASNATTNPAPSGQMRQVEARWSAFAGPEILDLQIFLRQGLASSAPADNRTPSSLNSIRDLGSPRSATTSRALDRFGRPATPTVATTVCSVGSNPTELRELGVQQPGSRKVRLPAAADTEQALLYTGRSRHRVPCALRRPSAARLRPPRTVFA